MLVNLVRKGDTGEELGRNLIAEIQEVSMGIRAGCLSQKGRGPGIAPAAGL